jgi:hypothetical protein
LKKFIPENELWPDGPSMDHHYTQANSYWSLEMFSTKTLDENVFFAQMIQADTLQYVFGLYRSRQFRSSGALLWQFQSAWPEGSYSIVDYYAQPKMAYYWLKQACQPRTLVIIDDGWEVAEGKQWVLKVFAVNGLSDKLDGEVSLVVWSQSGRKVHEEKWRVCVRAQSSKEVDVVTIPVAKLEKGVYLVRSVLKDETGQCRQMDRLYAYPNWASAKEMVKTPSIRISRFTENQIEIENSGPEAAIVVEIRDCDMPVSDNFFNLIPGETQTVSGNLLSNPKIHIFNNNL